jgi:hypothetical protein
MPGQRQRSRLLAAALLGLSVLAGPARAEGPLSYDLDVEVELAAGRDLAQVELRVRQDAHLLKEVRWRTLPADGLGGDGALEEGEEGVLWRVPAEGGRLRYSIPIRHRRNSKGHDAWIDEDYAIFRGDDLVPPARTLAEKGALSRTRLRIATPEGWSSITPYPKDDEGWYLVDWPDRRFDRPVGWIAAGRLGVRRATLDGVEVAVAGPVDLGLRRMDTLAFLSWNLPALTAVFDDFPARLLVVSAGDPMWRGGLSGPWSLFLHQDRPLISENGTSTLMHELMHLAQRYSAEPGADWIVEGLAEYYSVEFMRRTGTLPQEQAERAFGWIRDYGRDVKSLRTDRSGGRITARAATLFADLDRELRRATGGEASLDDVARALTAAGEPVDLPALRSAFERLAGAPSALLAAGKVPGY